METEVECEEGFVVIYNSLGAGLFPQLSWIAYERGSCADDTREYGATPEAAVANLKQLIEDLS